MLISFKEVVGYRIKATDGKIGRVADFYVDQRAWTVNHIVVDLCTWIPGPLVLLPPSVARHPEQKNRVLPVSLSVEEVDGSPSTESDLPPSIRKKPGFWQTFALGPRVCHTIGMPPVTIHSQAEEQAISVNPNLQSLKGILGYKVVHEDEKLGKTCDFILKTKGWLVQKMIITTGRWPLGEKNMIPTEGIGSINNLGRKVGVNA